MVWLAVINASIGFGLGLFDIGVGAVYAGLNFIPIFAAGVAAASRGGAAWFVLFGGRPTERLTAMEKRLVAAGLAGVGSVLAALLTAPLILN